jgi:branched-chain amino acid transport system substrate-binding protein
MKKLFFVPHLFAACCLLLTSCAFSTTQKRNAIVIGTTLSITGKTAKEGESALLGYQLYLEELEKRGGMRVGDQRLPVKFIHYDDESRPERAVELFEKLIVEDKVDILFGPYGSTPTAAVAEVAEKHRVPMLVAHGSASAVYRDGNRYTFGIQTPARNYLFGIIDLVTHLDPSIKTIAILTEDDVFARDVTNGATAYAQEKGLTIVYSQIYPAHAQDVSVLLSEVRKHSPDLLLGAGHLQDSILVTRQVHDVGLTPKAMGFSVGPSYPEFRANLKRRANYIFGATQWTDALQYHGDDYWKTPKAYAAAFRARFPNYSHVPYQAAESSAELFVLEQALEKAGSLDRERVRDALASIDVKTFFGRIKFDARGTNSQKPMAVEQLQTDGNKYTVYPFEVSERKAEYPMQPQP